MYNSKNDYINKSAERNKPSLSGRENSLCKNRSNFKKTNLKNNLYENDENLRSNEFSAKNNLINNFQNLQKNNSIFNM